MAEYAEVMKQFHRMCAGGKCPKAIKCPMYPACNISQCRRIAFEKPAEFENRVMGWAAEHPEPKYPTWYDYLFSIGVFYNEHTAGGDVTKIHWGNTMTPIPADIAEKLGIQPEEHFAGADKKEG